jgi:hypothetical protein
MAAQVQRETCRVVAGIGVVLRSLTIADLLNAIQRKRKMDGWTRLEGRTALGSVAVRASRPLEWSSVDGSAAFCALLALSGWSRLASKDWPMFRYERA